MKRFLSITLILCMAVLMVSCGKKETKDDATLKAEISGKTFVWEKEGFGGDFTIKLDEYGQFEYYVGLLSSYIGHGNWEVKDGVLTLQATVDSDDVFNFSVENGKLVFIAEGSDGFRGGDVTVEDGDKFLLKEE